MLNRLIASVRDERSHKGLRTEVIVTIIYVVEKLSTQSFILTDEIKLILSYIQSVPSHVLTKDPV